MGDAMNLTTLLSAAISIKGVRSAAVVSSDGLVLEGASRDAQDPQDLGFAGGLLVSALASSRVLAGLLGEGELSQAMLEYETGPVLLIPLSAREDAPVMVATLEATSALGRARMGLRKLLPDIAQAAGA